MIELDREGVVAPATWKVKVDGKLPDATQFWAEAEAFEKLPLSRRREVGFEKHAKHVLPAPEHAFPAVWRQDRALKKLLSAMTNGHCAYCQGSVSDVGAGAVEHWKPKSLFPLLAYEWDNYFFSCERCNLAKSNKWPEHGEYVRPDEGDPAARFVFTARGRIRGRAGDAAARRTVKDFGLNRPKLCERRAAAIRKVLRSVRCVMEQPGLTEEQRYEVVKTLCAERMSAFSEAINQNVRRVWRQVYTELAI